MSRFPEVTPKQTNADRIRSMTDEELAEFILKKRCTDRVCPMTECFQCWLDWLKQEAGE